MCSNFQGLNIIDLISEKHAKLRKMVKKGLVIQNHICLL